MLTQYLKKETINPFDPEVIAGLWRKWQRGKDERKPMDPEALAEKVSDRLIKILEKELERRLAQKKGMHNKG